MPIYGWKKHPIGAGIYAAHKIYQKFRGSGGGFSSGVGRTFRRGQSYGAGAIYAASTHRVRSSYRRRRRVPYRRRIALKRFKRFGRKVKRAIKSVTRHRRRGIGKNPPKWHIYRSTGLLNPTSTFTAQGQATLDIAHGFQGHLDGLVALAQVARSNYFISGLPPVSLNHPDCTVRVHKSYMILFMTNNSNTPIYGKMAVYKPRKNINDIKLLPSALANQDLSFKQYVANEWLGDQQLVNDGFLTTYAAATGATENVRSTNLTDLGWIHQNSPSFNRYWKGKLKDVSWAPMECKKFTFKMRKRFVIDCNTEYTLQPSTSASTQTWADPNSLYLTPSDSGFSYMHRSRGFFVSFLMHGIPARDAGDATVGLTQPKMDMYWLNAYKYSWSAINRREFHVNPNPLGAITPQIVQMFTPTAGPPVNG